MIEITRNDINTINMLCLKNGENYNLLSINRLESALGNQYAPYDSEEKCIVSVYRSLILNHPYENGNKRTAVIVLNYLAASIHKKLLISDEELGDLTYRIASENGGMIEVDELSSIIFKNVEKINNSDNLIVFTKSYCIVHCELIDRLAA